MPSLQLGLGTHIPNRALVGGSGGVALDPLVSAFQTDSGATDVTALDALIKYVRGQSLLSNFRIYPMKSAQNAGSGSTVYGVGSLTANNMTLVNSPTWGAGGITLNGTNQYGSIADFLSSASLTVFARHALSTATPTTENTLVAQYEGLSGEDRSFMLDVKGNEVGDPYRVVRSSNGSAATNSAIFATSSGLNVDHTFVASFPDGSTNIEIWRNKTDLAESGAATNTSRLNTGVNITVGTMTPSSPRNWYHGVITCVAFFEGATLTSTQRETITDLVNAL